MFIDYYECSIYRPIHPENAFKQRRYIGLRAEPSYSDLRTKWTHATSKQGVTSKAQPVG